MRLLSTRSRAELWRHQALLRAAAERRRTALRVLLTSRFALSESAQMELWQEFSDLDQEYRFAILQLSAFCTAHNNRTTRSE